MSVTQEHLVPAAADGARLDQFLTAAMDDLTRSQIGRAVAEGRVTVAGVAATKAGQRVQTGQRVVIVVPPPIPDRAAPEDLPLSVRYEDRDLIVVAKPAGLVVHPAHGHPSGTLVNALLYHCSDLSGIGGVKRPGIVHRLDRDTSGLMVVAKNDQSHLALSALFKAHAVDRRYMAVVEAGARFPAEGEFRTRYGRHPTDRLRFSSRVTEGRDAVTYWRTLCSTEGLHWVEVRLETGRTHQIRVHFADHGYPILGDPLYGRAGKTRRDILGRIRPLLEATPAAAGVLSRQALHAYTLGFAHPRDGRALHFREPPPEDLQQLLEALFGAAEVREVWQRLEHRTV
jgi:23S rRNA pseudouridine1911/1915/1917 synthase